MTAHSIFNDVLGPIMAGPSSSHSAGCARIGRQTAMLWGKDIKKACVIYDSQGSYPSTCVGQGSNFGFTGGLLGMMNDDPEIKNSIAIAKRRGVEIVFSEEKLSARHPNEARIEVLDDDGSIGMTVLTFSTGGGMFEIVELDGFEVFIDGSFEQVFVRCGKEYADEAAQQLVSRAEKVKIAYNGSDDVLLCLSGIITSAEEIKESFGGDDRIKYIRSTGIVLPIEMRQDGKAVFMTAKEALDYGADRPMWQLALDYECSIGRADEAEVMAQALKLCGVMRAAAKCPDPGTTERFGFLPYQCRSMQENRGKVRTVDTGFLNKAMFYAIAVMENSCAHNIVAASPTAGSSGVVPAAVVAVGEQMRLDDEEIAKGLLAAGVAGAFIANQATFGAEVAACQAENGAASAMAAAGVVQLLGGTAKQGFAAASLALQNMLGLICDPVGGLTEIPCISRNVAAMSNAVMSANMVMLGFDPVIPFDETIETMLRVGRQLPAELRCTCGGGLCLTPSAKCAVKRIGK